MINKIKEFFYNYKINRIRKRYRSACYEVGCAESYWFMGEAIGYQLMRDNLAYWTKQTKKFKIQIANKEERIKFGGYGIEYEK